MRTRTTLYAVVAVVLSMSMVPWACAGGDRQTRDEMDMQGEAERLAQADTTEGEADTSLAAGHDTGVEGDVERYGGTDMGADEDVGVGQTDERDTGGDTDAPGFDEEPPGGGPGEDSDELRRGGPGDDREDGAHPGDGPGLEEPDLEGEAFEEARIDLDAGMGSGANDASLALEGQEEQQDAYDFEDDTDGPDAMNDPDATENPDVTEQGRQIDGGDPEDVEGTESTDEESGVGY